MSLQRLVGLCAVFLLVACGSSDGDGGTTTDDVAPADSGDGGVAIDVGEDAAPDVADDAAPDVGEDAAPDAGDDAAPDVGEDAAPDAAEDTAPDVGEDTAPDVADDVVADVAPDADGACASNGDCAASELCDRPAGACAAEGTCAERPSTCPRVVDPVCGCDGVDYLNPCLARQAGTTVATEGECAPSTDCATNGDCGRAQYCESPTGTCGAGTCVARPTGCADVYSPVCGCDDSTYGNACEAASAGVNVAAVGECGATDGCTTNLDCLRSEWCRFADGVCNGIGTCEVRPEICPLVIAEVCGCDGTTYVNACEAYRAGANVEYDGVCDPTTEEICRTASDCTRGEYCDFSFESACMRTGVCATRPDGCLDIYDPVCGCDGRTYGNACAAAAAGASVLAPGECPVP